MSRRELRTELERSRASVEDAAGCAVTAFRAQDFSIRRENLWALETLADVGFEIDSSIFPMRLKRYGIDGWNVAPQVIDLANGASIIEVPVAVWRVGRWRVPIAGGGYFRVLPQSVIERGLRSVARDRPAVVYVHPYEFSDGELAEYNGSIPRTLRLSQGLGRGHFVPRIRSLLEKLPFGRFDDTLKSWGVT
jgi:hypothetical protein